MQIYTLKDFCAQGWTVDGKGCRAGLVTGEGAGQDF